MLNNPSILSHLAVPSGLQSLQQALTRDGIRLTDEQLIERLHALERTGEVRLSFGGWSSYP